MTKAVYVENFKDSGKSYSLSLEWLTSKPSDISVSTAPNVITSGSGDSSYIPVVLGVSATAQDGAYEGILKLTSGTEVLRLPLNVLVGDKFNLDPVNQLSLDDAEISPNGDGLFDKTGFYFSVNKDLPNIRFAVTAQDAPATVIGDVYSAQGTIYRGAHEFLDWGGTVTDPATSKVSVLPDGHYNITPVLQGNIWLTDQAIPFTIDTEKPLSSGYAVEEYEQESPDDARVANISATIDSDLLADLISTSRPVSSLFSVYALAEDENGEVAAYPGAIAPDGYFEIDVPVSEGVNDYIVYVTDALGNGAAEEDYSQHLVYNTNGGVLVAPKLSAQTIETGQTVTVDVYFSATDAVYGVNGAGVNIVYDEKLAAPLITPSVQLATYQEQKFPGFHYYKRIRLPRLPTD